MTAQSWKSALTDEDSSAQETLGTIREGDNKVYKYVKFSGTTAQTAGDFVCYVVTDETLQTVDKAASVLPAGVAMITHSGTGTAYYGWIQIRGVATLNVALDAGADGDALTNDGATAGTLTVIDAHAEPQVAIALDISDKQVILMCPN